MKPNPRRKFGLIVLAITLPLLSGAFLLISRSERERDFKDRCLLSQRGVSASAAAYMKENRISSGAEYEHEVLLKKAGLSNPSLFECPSKGRYWWAPVLPDVFAGEPIIRCSVEGHELDTTKLEWVRTRE